MMVIVDRTLDRWTTFLSPVQVNVLVSMNGDELDLTNRAFDTVLGQDMNNTFGFSNGTLVTQPGASFPFFHNDDISDAHALSDSSNSLTSFGFTGGLTSATAYASGQPGILNFNNVTYSVSTGTYSNSIIKIWWVGSVVSRWDSFSSIRRLPKYHFDIHIRDTRVFWWRTCSNEFDN